MEDIVINGKALYTPKGAALEYGRVGCNFYTGCPHNCEYCYLKRGAPSKQLGGTEVRLKKCFKDEEDALSIFSKELDKHIGYLRRYGVFFSFTTDPLINETMDVTFKALHRCAIRGIPVKVLTKNADFISKLYSLPTTFVNHCRDWVSFGFTLTGRDDMEPNASSNQRRIEVMRYLHMDGFKTWASIEPVIDWQSSVQVIRDSMEWCDHYKLGLRSGVKKDYYNLRESGPTIMRIVEMCEVNNRTLYLKESTRKLLQHYLKPGAYEALLSHTVDMDGNRLNSKKD